jgi:hypothetical protein
LGFVCEKTISLGGMTVRLIPFNKALVIHRFTQEYHAPIVSVGVVPGKTTIVETLRMNNYLAKRGP